MSQPPAEMLRAAQDVVKRLVEQCIKYGPLYKACPKKVAQVNRTAKWLLNAIVALAGELKASSSK